MLIYVNSPINIALAQWQFWEGYSIRHFWPYGLLTHSLVSMSHSL